MKLSISFFLVVICTMCLAAQQSQAKKGCNAYGYACYGGHGKRSLRSDIASGIEQNDLLQQRQQQQQQQSLHPEQFESNGLQYYPSEANTFIDGDLDAYPRYHLIKLMKSWFGTPPHRRVSLGERIPEVDYPISGELFRENSPIQANRK